MTPGQIASYKAARDYYSSPSVEQRQRDEELRVNQVLGSLMRRVPVEIRIGSWTILHHGIDVRLGGYGESDHEHRAHMMMLAEQFDLKYTEGEVEHDPAQNMVTATGDFEGAPVKFWRYVAPCKCGECGAGR